MGIQRRTLPSRIDTYCGTASAHHYSCEDDMAAAGTLTCRSQQVCCRWIAERKKSWPSKANIERKAEEAKAKAAERVDSGNKRKREAGDAARPPRPCRKFAAGKCNFGDKCHFSHDPQDCKPTKRVCRNFTNGKCKFGNKCKFSHSSADKELGAKGAQRKKTKPSLLTKLLSTEIATEQTLVLQCLKFIASKHFFLDI